MVFLSSIACCASWEFSAIRSVIVFCKISIVVSDMGDYLGIVYVDRHSFEDLGCSFGLVRSGRLGVVEREGLLSFRHL